MIAARLPNRQCRSSICTAEHASASRVRLCCRTQWPPASTMHNLQLITPICESTSDLLLRKRAVSACLITISAHMHEGGQRPLPGSPLARRHLQEGALCMPHVPTSEDGQCSSLWINQLGQWCCGGPLPHDAVRPGRQHASTSCCCLLCQPAVTLCTPSPPSLRLTHSSNMLLEPPPPRSAGMTARLM